MARIRREGGWLTKASSRGNNVLKKCFLSALHQRNHIVVWFDIMKTRIKVQEWSITGGHSAILTPTSTATEDGVG